MKKRRIIPILIILLLTLFMGIGYAGIANISLEIDGSASLPGQTGIFISSATMSSSQNANTTNSQINMYYQTDIDSHIELSTTDPDSYITYQVTIMNTTANTMYFDTILYDSNHYSNPNIIAETNLLPYQSVNANQSITFNVTYQYLDNYTASATTPYTNTLDSFINIHFTNTPPPNSHTVTYVGFGSNNYPATVADGGTLTVTFNSPAPNQVSVLGSNNYTYSNGTLTVPNVVNNLTVENLDGYDFPVVDPGNNQPCEIHAPDISSSHTIQVNDLLNLSFTGFNGSNRNINQVDAVITYTSSTGSVQSINVILTIGNQQYSQTAQFSGKQTNSTVTVSFTGITIAPGEEFSVSSTRENITNGNITISDEKLIFHFASN